MKALKELKMLFTPTKIGSMELKNRIVMGPIGMGYCPPDGTVSQRDIDHYEAQARGGVGLIIAEITAIHPRGVPAGGIPQISDDKHIAGWAELAKAVHAQRAKIVVQIGHGGREAHPMLIGGQQSVSSSPVPSPVLKIAPHELTIAEIEELVECYGQAARRVRAAGLDGIEIHAAHGYLVHGFMSALSNKRTDAYGGDMAGRMKFPLEIIARIRREVGRDFPLIFRMTGDEMWPEGWQLEQAKVIARMVAEAGIDAIEVSRGCYNIIRWIVPPMGTPIALNVPLAAGVKESVNVPVLVVGRIKDPIVAESILEEGKADLIVMSRALLADPDLPKKASSGNFEDIIPCTSCSECLQRVLTMQPVICMVNPVVGREREMSLVPAGKPKKVLVVGGGPAGLECARVAALRGHEVTLYEKGDRLGGQLNIAAVPPAKQELAPVVKYYSIQLNKLGVRIELGKEVTPAVVEELSPDAAVIATGSTPLIPDMPGATGPRVVTAHNVLAGKVVPAHLDTTLQTMVGNRVIIVGGGMVGAETADYCGEMGCEVHIVELLPDIGLDMVIWQKEFLLERLRNYGVKVITSAEVKEILEDGVAYSKDGKEETIRGADNIILAMGAKSVQELSEKIKGKAAEVYVIGDAKEPRKALEAIAEGTEIGRKI